MINVIYNNSDYEITQRKMEVFDKYLKVIQWGRRNPVRFMEMFFGLQFTDHQRYVLLSTWTTRFAVWLMSRNSGKHLWIETPILTPDGQKKMLDIKSGDYVFDRFGKPTKVLATSSIELNKKCYELTFDDGEKIIASDTHSWYVHYKTKKLDEYGYQELQTKDMCDDFIIYNYRGQKSYKYSIPVCEPVDFPDKKLEIDPYFLGYWLGDGFLRNPQICCSKDDSWNLIEQFKKTNYTYWIGNYKSMRNIDVFHIDTNGKNNNGEGSFLKGLKAYNILYDKRIPEDYFSASYAQRLSLLQGIMDSDGTVDKTGWCSISQSEKHYLLLKDISRLLDSLGIKNKIKPVIVKDKIKNKEYKNNRIWFKTDKNNPCFRLTRKYERLVDNLKSCVKRKAIINIKEVDTVPVKCLFVESDSHTYICGDKYTVTHNSYLSAPYMMARSILIPNHHSYIMCPSGNQAQETFGKIEDLAKNKIASVQGATAVFLGELVKLNAGDDGFVHDKNSHHCELYNGSTINTLNSVAKNIVGIRSHLNFYDEAGKVDRDYFALTKPFCTQDRDFVTGSKLNIQCYPRQMPNQIIYASSAESMDSELYDAYKDGALAMIAGSSDYFVCDITCELSLNPYLNGKPYKPLLSREQIDDALKKNEFRANREYFNKFDLSGGQDALVKRTTVLANSYGYRPIYYNESGTQTFIITYDPSSKIDNSVVLISELIDDPEKGLMLKLVNLINLIDKTPSGDKKVVQKPEQIERIKKIILDYNGRKNQDYTNINRILIDAGSGGGGFDVAQFLLKDWSDEFGFTHRGIIDYEDKYLKEEKDKFPGAADILTLVSFTGKKAEIYQACQDMINQGLVMFPKSLNLKSEMEFEEVDKDGNVKIIMERMDSNEITTLVEFDMLKEELIAMQKTEQNKVVKFDLLPSKKAENMHDDRADVCAMACWQLFKLRSQNLLHIERDNSGFKKVFDHGIKKQTTPFSSNRNPFSNSGPNPFLRSR